MKAAAIENDFDALTGESRRGAPVMPSNKAVRDGLYIPLGRPLFLYVNGESFKQKPDVADFLRFFLGNAGKSSTKLTIFRYRAWLIVSH